MWSPNQIETLPTLKKSNHFIFGLVNCFKEIWLIFSNNYIFWVGKGIHKDKAHEL